MSAELLGPVMKLMQEAICSPFFTFSFMIRAACVMRGTMLLFGIIMMEVAGKKLTVLPLSLLLKRTAVPDSASVTSLIVIPTLAVSAFAIFSSPFV